jgi:type I restriction enzyme, S subunit
MSQIADHRLGKMLDKGKNKGELRPYLRNTNVQWFRFDLNDIKEMRFEEDELQAYEVQVGDLLICEGGEPGRCAVWDRSSERFMIQKAIHRVRPLGGISPDYLALRLRFDAISGRLGTQFTGATIQHFTGQELARYGFPLPPVKEQHRIVAKVDQLMVLCDELEARQKAKRETRERLVASALDKLTSARDAAEFDAHWHRLRDHFDLIFDHPSTIQPLRQAVLQLAVEGKLVPQDPSDGSASVIAETVRSERCKVRSRNGKPRRSERARIDGHPFEIPESWTWIAAEDLTAPGRPIRYGIIKPGPDTPGGVPYVRITEMKNGEIDMSSLRRCRPDHAARFKEATLRTGDLLISKDGTIGRVAIVPPALEGGNITQHILRYSPSHHINAYYLILSIRSPHCQSWMRGETKGVALQGVNVMDFRQMPIPVPPPAEQGRIVAKVDVLMTQCDELEVKLRQTESASESLLSSTIAHLLNGTTTPDP